VRSEPSLPAANPDHPSGSKLIAPPAAVADAGLVVACADPSVLAEGTPALEQAGVAIEFSTGWGDTLARVEARRPDLVIIDGRFLDGAGYRLCAALRRAPWGDVPALFICARKKDIRTALASGATDVVLQPIDWQLMAQRVRTQVSLSRTRKELDACQTLLRHAQRARAEAWGLLEQQNNMDPLTGLPNAVHLERLLDHALAGARGAGSGVALFLLDLDDFSDINHTLGRRSGDEALRSVGRRLNDFLRTHDVQGRGGPGLRLRAAVRVGNDQFALLLTNVGDTKRLPAFAQGVLDVISDPIRLGESEVFLSASMGVAISSPVTRLGERLLQHAETAMREVRRRGGRAFHFYSEALNGSLERRLGLDRMLRHAVENDELSVLYQPILDARTSRVVAAEALLRWRHPVLGPVPPTEFVPLAERTGLMKQLGEWVLRGACWQLRKWLDAGQRPLRMAVNISRCQLEDGDLPETLRAILLETGIDPALLELELSERGVLRNDKDLLRQVHRLKGLGVRLTVDDFGTGDTVIAHLGQLPLDGLKIDQSLVSELASGEDDGLLTSAIVALAHRLRLSVTAEGVELESQREILRGYGCEEVQGFLFSEAISPEEFVRFVTAGDAEGSGLEGREPGDNASE
jgi:diguanylate cyclase (GGDEF)-like protein